MIITFGQSDHLLEAGTLVGFSSGNTKVREDLQDYNIVLGCIVPEEVLLGVRGDLFLIMSGYPDVAVCIFYAHCITFL